MKTEITGELIDFGFKVPELKLEDHIFGGMGGAIINPSGDWSPYRPIYEAQADNFETQGCTVWGTENAIEYLYRFHFGVEKNYEELPPYIGAGIHPDFGGDPNKVAQWIRDNGLVEAPNCPFPTLKETLLALLNKALPSNIVELGKSWNCKLRHQWVLQGPESIDRRMDAIKRALPYGIVGASFTAWFQNEEGIYVDNGQRNTHWAVIEKATPNGWQVFDTYDHSVKIYSYDSRTDFAKLYFLEKLATTAQKKSWYEGLVAFFKAFLSPKESEEAINNLKPILMPEKSKKEQLVELVKSYIGYDASPENAVMKEVACAEGASAILHQVFPEFPKGVVSTAGLFTELQKSPLFKTRLTPKAGCIVISPRTKTVNGHAGFFISEDEIVSNSSKTGLMEQNYNWRQWVKSFKEGKGLRIFIFELK